MFPAILFMGALIVRELRAAVILAIVGMHMLAN
jgi:hypothetical protein